MICIYSVMLLAACVRVPLCFVTELLQPERLRRSQNMHAVHIAPFKPNEGPFALPKALRDME